MTITRWERGELPDARNFLMLCEELELEPMLELLDEPIEGEDISYYFGHKPNKSEGALRLVLDLLASILTSDKTPPYNPGDPNNEGEAPNDGAAFLTPRQLAHLALTRIRGVVGDAEQDITGA